jgi:hypothetical protein
VTVYAFDTSQTDFKGDVIDTGSTDSSAAIIGLSLPSPVTPPYIMEFTSNTETKDLTTGITPVISTLRAVITQEILNSGKKIYATPLTTMAVDIAISNSSSSTTAQQFETALVTAASDVVSTVGFGMSGNIDIFNTPPLIDNSTITTSEQADVALYRSAIEAFTAVVYQMGQQSTAGSGDALMTELSGDLADGKIDGMIGGSPTTVFTSTTLDIFEQNPYLLPIPNSPTNQTVADVQKILVSETAITGTTNSTADLDSAGSINTMLVSATVNPDSDGDGILNAMDAFPYDRNETIDTDGDGIGDNTDTDDDNNGILDEDDNGSSTPTAQDGDGDGINDDSDNCPAIYNPSQTNTDTIADGGDACDTDDDNDGAIDSNDLFPLNANEQSDLDGDGEGNNADLDDDNDGIEDEIENGLGNSVDHDGDGIPNREDTDSDNDGVLDNVDFAPFNGSVTFNHAPVTTGSSLTTKIGELVSIVLNVDDDGVTLGSLSFIITEPSNGAISGTAPNLNYTPNNQFIGSDSFTFTAMDSAGKESNTSTVTIAVVDMTKPIITIAGDNPVIVGIGTSYDDAGASAIDAVDGVLSVISTSEVDTATLGDYTLNYSATDAAGNIENVTRTVSVRDITPPVITLNGTVNFFVEQGTSYLEEGATATDAIDGDISVVITGLVISDTTGEYHVTYTATDVAGNESSVLRIVNVQDTIAPVITITGDNPTNIDQNGLYSEQGSTATDTVDGNLSGNVVITGTVDTSNVSSYTVTYTVSDNSGNVAINTRTVNVNDVTKPVITIAGDNPVIVGIGTSYDDAGASAIDAVDGVLSVISTGEVDTATLGDYTLNYSATDAAGNIENVTRTVSVRDITPPVITLNGEESLTIYKGGSYVEFGATAVDAIDGNLSDSIQISGSVDVNLVGTYSIFYTVTDNSGNESTATRSININYPNYDFTFNDPDLTLYEGEYVHKFILTFSQQFSVARNLSVTVLDDSVAINNADFELLTSDIEVLENTAGGFIQVKIIDDIFFEGSESIKLKILADNGVETFITIELDDTSSPVIDHSYLPVANRSRSMTTVIDDTLILSGSSLGAYDLISETSLGVSESGLISTSFILFGGDAVTDGENIFAFLKGVLYQIDEDTLTAFKISASPFYTYTNSQLQIIGNEIYLIGGGTNTAGGGTSNELASTSVFAYDFINNTWSTKADLNHQRSNGATALVDGKLYVFGGNYSDNTVEVYDPILNSWSFLSSNSALSSYLDTALSNGKYVYVIISDSSETTTVLRYDTYSDLWESFTVQTPSTTGQDTFYYKGRIYLVGGSHSNNMTSFYIGDDQ